MAQPLTTALLRTRVRVRESGGAGRGMALTLRVLQAIPIAFGVTILTFLLMHAIPGDPARAALGDRATPLAIASLRSEWGLDRPLAVQYWRYLGRVLHGDLGSSLFYGQSTLSIIGSYAPATAWLIVVSCLMSVIISVPVAAAAALTKSRVVDQIIRLGCQIGLGAPAPWVGLILVLTFAIKVRWFPVGGFGNGPVAHLSAMILPSLTVAIGIAPLLIRALRAEMLQVLGSDYVTTARSKGLSESRVLTRHVLRNAAVSAITILGLNIAGLVSGSVIVESVFAVPGLGNLLVSSISRRDFPVVQGLALVFAVLVIIVNLLTDFVRAVLDPRVGLR
ncbi:ABC transporter permease [Kribbella solani]|uniref:Peptide/nickel transport system permease protein n=1 Tax=Kribbella solani TaxID=236067 RepID=A0A841DQ00_9ACTN|nr:ABC transporter permease [Kribbella solani]MBB5979971.1 peptide/nickel transport system permease protein [Kribbella solani]